MQSTPFVASNPCVRCGKQRIDGKTWKEKVVSHFGTSYIYHTETKCPDKECQKIVEEKMNQAKQKIEDLRQEKENRNIARFLAAKKAAKNKAKKAY